MTKAIFGLAASEEQAQRIVDQLLRAGFSDADISILSQDKRQQNRLNATDNTFDNRDIDNAHRAKKAGQLSTEKHTKAPEGGVTGATTGGILGGSLGLLAGLGALSIPGVGPFIAAGPIMAALGGSAVGGSLGLLIGALIGSGIPEFEARKYEASLKSGNILISVHTDNSEELSRAKDIMKRENAKDISESREKTGNRQ